jgi:hypothetical protein
MSIFFDEWRESLREHYKYIIRINDKVTLKSLRGQMHELGFSEIELKELEVLAFVRTEDAPEGFVPDLEALRPADEPQIFPSVEINDQVDETEISESEQIDNEDDDDSDQEPPSQTQQLSLF